MEPPRFRSRDEIDAERNGRLDEAKEKAERWQSLCQAAAAVSELEPRTHKHAEPFLEWVNRIKAFLTVYADGDRLSIAIEASNDSEEADLAGNALTLAASGAPDAEIASRLEDFCVHRGVTAENRRDRVTILQAAFERCLGWTLGNPTPAEEEAAREAAVSAEVRVPADTTDTIADTKKNSGKRRRINQAAKNCAESYRREKLVDEELDLKSWVETYVLDHPSESVTGLYKRILDNREELGLTDTSGRR